MFPLQMRKNRHTCRHLCFLAVLLLLLALVSCGDGEGETTTAPTAPETSATATTTAPPVTTAAPVTAPPVTTIADPRPGPTPADFKVTLDPANGNAPTVRRVDVGAKAVKLPADPEKTGEVFLGWFYDGNPYRPYHGEIIVRDCTLTARYAPLAHTVTFATGDAVAEFSATRVADGEPLYDFPIVRRATERESVWCYDAALTRPYAGEPITEDITLYPAFWNYVSEIESTLPALHITTEGGAPITSKEDYLRATLSVVGGSEGDRLTEVGTRIRGRGNSTWNYFNKKPYRLKLDESADLLGLGKEKDFVLLANAGDPTLLHNYALFTLADLFGDTVTSDCRFVSLYLNGAYEGVYLLCEQNEAGDGRVPVKDGGSGTDVGYLIEFGGNAADPPKYSFPLRAVTKGGVTYRWRNGFVATVKHPDEEEITAAQKTYITEYVNRVNAAIFTGDYKTFATLCDTESFASAFLANMILLNCDMDFSLYFYKPAGEKLHFGPLWDADQAAGTSTKCGTITEGWEVSRYDHWFTALLKIPEFRAEVEALWLLHREEIFALPDHLYLRSESMAPDIIMNELRHASSSTPYWRQCPEHMGYATYAEHLSFLYGWLTERIAWMDGELS